MRSSCPNEHLRNLMTPLKVCNWVKTGGKLGEGKDGYVIRACCGDECKFIVKVIENKGVSGSTFMQKVGKEVMAHSKAAELGIAPAILDAWMCQNEGSIVTMKKDYDLVKYVAMLSAKGISRDKIVKIIGDLQKETLQKIKKFHNAGWVHGDLHLENVMIDVDEDDDWYNLQIIDFGKSENEGSSKSAEAKETEKEIVMSFDMLKRNAGTVTSYVPQAPSKKKPTRTIESSGFFSPSPTKMKFSPMSTPRKPSLFDSPQKSPAPIRRGGLFDSPQKSPRPIRRGGLFDDFEEI